MNPASQGFKTHPVIPTVVLILFAAATVWINYQVKANIQGGHGSSGTVNEMGNVKLGQPALDFSVKDLSGRTVTLADYRGQKAVLLDFWATWCGPCRMEMTSLQKLQDKFGGKDFEILSLNQGEAADQVNQFIARKKYGFHVLLDTDNDVAAKYGVRAIPTLVLVDKTGAIQWLQVGYSENDSQLEQKIASLTGK